MIKTRKCFLKEDPLLIFNLIGIIFLVCSQYFYIIFNTGSDLLQKNVHYVFCVFFCDATFEYICFKFFCGSICLNMSNVKSDHRVSTFHYVGRGQCVSTCCYVENGLCVKLTC